MDLQHEIKDLNYFTHTKSSILNKRKLSLIYNYFTFYIFYTKYFYVIYNTKIHKLYIINIKFIF